MTTIIPYTPVVPVPEPPGGPGTPSGTYGQTQLNVAQIIEHAYRRATGGPVSQMAAEELYMAREALFMVLSAFVNKGLSLWCVLRAAIPVALYQARYYLPVGTEDVLTVNLREGTFSDATTLALGSTTKTFTTETQVAAVEMTLPASTATWYVEASVDNATWELVGAYSGTLGVAATVVVDCDPQPSYLYWRARQSVALDTPTAARFVYAVRETTLGKISRDDYVALPDKGVWGRPTQYWYDKQNTPSVLIWQSPSSTNYELALTLQMTVQDVGDLQNTLAIPSRWLKAAVSALAVWLRMELPKERIGIATTLGELREMAAEDLQAAGDSETDGAPIRIIPNIGVYTR